MCVCGVSLLYGNFGKLSYSSQRLLDALWCVGRRVGVTDSSHMTLVSVSWHTVAMDTLLFFIFSLSLFP